MSVKKGDNSAQIKYLKEKVDSFRVYVPKGQKATIQARAREKGLSVNAYIVGLIQKDLEERE